MAQRSLVVMAPFFPVLVALGLWQRLWDSLHSLLLPVFSVFDTIDPDTLTISSITAQFIKAVLSMGQLAWNVGIAVLELSLKPLKNCLQEIARLVEEIRQEHLKPKPRISQE